MRTQDEIVARYTEVRGKDFLGFKAAVLLSYLDFAHAEPFLKEGTTEAQWAASEDPAELEERARDYLTFAFGKSVDHRGISANRSVDKLEEYAWLLGREDVLEAMQDAEYENYGVPKLVAFATGMGFPNEAEEDEGLANMAAGKPCRPDCEEGCGQPAVW